MSEPKLSALLELPQSPARTAALTAWIQRLFREGSVPVLVGGAAVELLTGGAYTTGDLDFVGTVPPAAAARFRAAGFERRGRHWIHPGGELFVEFPADELDPAEGSVTLEISGQKILILEPEAVIVDRLAAWQHWDSSIDGINAFLVWKATRKRLDRRKLARLVAARRVAAAWESLERFSGRFQEDLPSPQELEQWAETRES